MRSYTISEDSELLLQPPDQFSAAHRDWSEFLEIRLGFVVGSIERAGYHISLVDILRSIDLLLNKMSKA